MGRGYAKPPSGLSDQLEGLKTQNIIIFMAEIYHSKIIKNKISKGGKCMGQNPEETRHKLPRVLSKWSHTGGA